MTTHSDCLPAAAATRFAPARRVGRVFTNLLTRFAEWQERSQQRAYLAGMDDRMLKDIGVSQVDALRESDKPFWRA